MDARARTELIGQIARRADAVGLRRVHVVAWRDRDDPLAGGSEEHASQVARCWAQAGIDVTLRTGALRGAAATIERDGYRVVRHGGRIGVIPRTAVAGVLHRDGPRDGLVEVFHGFPFFAPLWARGPRIAVVHHVHLGAWRLLAPAPIAAAGHLIERFAVPSLYRRTSIVVGSDSTREELVHLGIPRDHIRVEPYGLDPRFGPGGRRAATPRVAAVGRIMPQKGFDTALRAFAEARRRVPDAELVVVGDGPARPALEALAVELGIDGCTTFRGRVPDDELVDEYRAAWIVLNASQREGWGLTLTEAAACGTPAVASRVPGHVDAVVDGETGLLADDVAGLAEATVRLLTDAEARARLGENARDRAAGFAWERVAATTLDALADEVRRRR